MPAVKITPLQMKGIFTLTLFLVAESSSSGVTFASAEGAATAASNSHNSNPVRTCDATTATSSECSAATGTGSAPVSTRILSQTTLDCATDCSHCVAVVDTIPRGGHSHVATAAAEGVLSAAAAAAATTTTPYGIPLRLWKVIFQALLTTINVVCWLVPLRSKTISNNKLALSLANAFSGGVFLSLAFTHLIPECTHGFAANPKVWPEAAPYGFILAGYLLIFFVEKVAFDAHDILHEMAEGGKHAGGGDHASHSHSHNNNHKQQQQVNGASAVGSPTSDSAALSTSSTTSTGGGTSSRGALILLVALGIHSILEMMALGLCDSFGDSALLTMSIALHQPAESIALLVAFLKSGMPKKDIIQFLSIFSCMGPIGVALGMAVNEYAAPIVDSIFLAIVAGTFVYVGATEVIPEEFESSENKWKKFGALMSGIVMIIAITQYTATLGLH